MRAPRSLLRRVCIAAAIMLAWLLVALLLPLTAPPPPPPPPLPVRWTSAESSPPPREFRYILFPPTTGVPVYDKPNGQVVGTLTRAVLGSINELDKQFVPIAYGSLRGEFEQVLLRRSAPASEATPMISALVREHNTGANSCGDFDLTAEIPESDGEAWVQYTCNGMTTKSTYFILGGTILPTRLQLDTHTGIAAKAPIIIPWRSVISFCSLPLAVAAAALCLLRK